MNTNCWTPPDYKSHYQNQHFQHFQKPILVIHNKYNDEWGAGPLNFIPVHILASLVETFSDKYQIIYIRASTNRLPPTTGFSWDANPEHPLDHDFNWIANHPQYGVLTMEDILAWDCFRDQPYNLVKLLLYAVCNDYITCQGGGAYMIAYFAKRLVIYHKQGGKEWQKGIYQHHSWMQHQLNPSLDMKLIAVRREHEIMIASKELFE